MSGNYRGGLWGTTFIMLLVIGVMSLGTLQYVNISLGPQTRALYKILTPLILLTVALMLRRSADLARFWDVFFALFIASLGYLVAWFGGSILNPPIDTASGLAIDKLSQALLTVVPILILLKVGGVSLGSVYIQRGNLKLGLVIGVPIFVGILGASLFIAEGLFMGEGLGWDSLLGWGPWIAIFVVANSLTEELVYRGLFLGPYGNLFGTFGGNLLQALVFASIHIGVSYTSSSLVFMFVVFGLGLALGWLTMKTKSLLAPILVHVAVDVPVIIGILTNL